MAGTSQDDERWAILFPEIIPTVFLLVASPIWIIHLLGRRQFGAALLLATGAGGAIYLFYLAYRRRLAWVAYIAVLLTLLTGVATYKIGGPWELAHPFK